MTSPDPAPPEPTPTATPSRAPAAKSDSTAPAPTPNAEPDWVISERALQAQAAEAAMVLIRDLLDGHRADTDRTQRLDIGKLASRFTDGPYDFDTAAADVLVIEADELNRLADLSDTAARARSAADAAEDAGPAAVTTVPGINGATTISPVLARAAAAQMGQVAGRLAQLGGFSLRSAEAVRQKALPTRGRHTPEQKPAADDQAPPVGTQDPLMQQGQGTEPSTEPVGIIAAQALLGSLLNAPDALGRISEILAMEDFPTGPLQAAYQGLLAMRSEDRLIEVSRLGTEADRVIAAHKNHERLQRHLSEHAPGMRAPTLVAELTSAAAAHTAGTDHLHQPRAQLRLAKMVLADTARRTVRQAGVQMRRATRVSPLPAVDRRRTLEAAQKVLNDLDNIAHRLGAAGDGTTSRPANEDLRELITSPERTQRNPMWEAVTARLAGRSERDLIHLALRGNAAVLNFSPQDFANREHANTWRAIKSVNARREPVNYVSVYTEIQAMPDHHRAALSAQQLQHLEQRTLISTTAMSRALENVARRAIRQESRRLESVTTALSNNKRVSADTVVAAARLGHRATAHFATATMTPQTAGNRRSR